MDKENVIILMEMEVDQLTQGPQHMLGHKETENYEPVMSRTLKIS